MEPADDGSDSRRLVIGSQQGGWFSVRTTGLQEEKHLAAHSDPSLITFSDKGRFDRDGKSILGIPNVFDQMCLSSNHLNGINYICLCSSKLSLVPQERDIDRLQIYRQLVQTFKRSTPLPSSL